MPDHSPMVEFRKVGKRFGEGHDVLLDLNLEVEEGEFVSFVGPSGCGKSTLLRMVAGLTAVSEGSLLIKSEAPTEPRDDLFFVFQEANLLPWARVLENVELPLKLKGAPPAERLSVAQSMIELVGLPLLRHS